MELELSSGSSELRSIDPVTLGGAGDGDPRPTVDSTNVTVSYGIHHGRYPIRGMTVREARQALERLINIDPGAIAVINGAPAAEDLQIAGNISMLSFVKPSAVKG
jgi:hypothetical protein